MNMFTFFVMALIPVEISYSTVYKRAAEAYAQFQS